MAALQPLYTSDNCKFAFQLRWGVTIHWREAVHDSVWLEPLQDSLLKDEIKILSWQQPSELMTKFALSTLPSHSPYFIMQRLKGRLQYARRERSPKALRPHYAIRSFGTQEREVIEGYIAKQPFKHPMAAERTQRIFEDLLYSDPTVDLSTARSTEHGTYWHNLHVVLVHEFRWRDVHVERLKKTQEVVLQGAVKHDCRISRVAILADHLHVAMRCSLESSPAEIVLAMMNNVAWVYEMKPVLCHSAFVGTLGEYDQRAVSGQRV
jgi:REP element-mobilizing transposase RayT